MKRYFLIGISIIVTTIFVLCAFTNVVGYQVIKSSNHQYFTKDWAGTIDDKPSIKTGLWNFPVTCIALFYFFSFFAFLYLAGVQIAEDIGNAIGQLAHEMNCWWARDNRLIPLPDEDCGC